MKFEIPDQDTYLIPELKNIINQLHELSLIKLTYKTMKLLETDAIKNCMCTIELRCPYCTHLKNCLNNLIKQLEA